jgi:mRNA interferase HicA
LRAKDLKRKLAALGATFEWGKGSHLRVILNGRKSVIPMHSSRELGIGLLRAIERDLGIKVK